MHAEPLVGSGCEPLRWTPQQVADYLRAVHLGEQYVQVFLQEEINGCVLLNLTRDKLRGPPFHITQYTPLETVMGSVERLRERQRRIQDSVGLPAASPPRVDASSPQQLHSAPQAPVPPPQGPPVPVEGPAWIPGRSTPLYDDGGPQVGLTFPQMPPPPPFPYPGCPEQSAPPPQMQPPPGMSSDRGRKGRRGGKGGGPGASGPVQHPLGPVGGFGQVLGPDLHMAVPGGYDPYGMPGLLPAAGSGTSEMLGAYGDLLPPDEGAFRVGGPASLPRGKGGYVDPHYDAVPRPPPHGVPGARHGFHGAHGMAPGAHGA
eukprot:Hpha_TRINITY_DN19858_c0_g1::TRINITY_DN19858_c0_g1_i1::g.132143::m.132143